MELGDHLLREARATLVEGRPLRIANFASFDPRPDDRLGDGRSIAVRIGRVLAAAVQSRVVPKVRFTAPSLVARTYAILGPPRQPIARALHELAIGITRQLAGDAHPVEFGAIGRFVVDADSGSRGRRVVGFAIAPELEQELRRLR